MLTFTTKYETTGLPMNMKMPNEADENSVTRPLNETAIGDCVRVVDVTGGRLMKQRLMSLGLMVGSEIEVLHHRGKGVVVGMNGNRIAVGSGVADRILIQKLEACGE
jgi:ferrous iron transport protein A